MKPSKRSAHMTPSLKPHPCTRVAEPTNGKMTLPRTKRAEFTRATRRLVAERAGYKCSFPACNQITVGPSPGGSRSITSGVAAHIYGAARSGLGPRGIGGLDDDELRSPQNAIWLCAYHSNLIDKQQGELYSPDTLHSYKALHETRVARELAGIGPADGWIDGIKIHSNPIFEEDQECRLGKLTFVIGDNSSGKTALCEWIASSSGVKHLERWMIPRRGEERRLHVKIAYQDPESHQVDVKLRPAVEFPEYRLDEERTIVPTARVRFIFPSEVRFPRDGQIDDLEVVSKAMGLHPLETLALCEDISNNGSDYVKRTWFEENEQGLYMFAEILEGKNTVPGTFPLRVLSGSARARILMELGVLAANRLAAGFPTVLILDAGFWRLDTCWMSRYVDFHASPACNFQTIATAHSTKVNFDELTWTGWKIVKFRGKPPKVMLVSGVRSPERS